MNAANVERSCACESGTEIDRVHCFVNHYSSLQRQRGTPLLETRVNELRNTNSIRELRVDVIDCRDVTEEIAQSLIIDSFLTEYCKTHPSFARESSPTNFKGKIEFFRAI